MLRRMNFLPPPILTPPSNVVGKPLHYDVADTQDYKLTLPISIANPENNTIVQQHLVFHVSDNTRISSIDPLQLSVDASIAATAQIQRGVFGWISIYLFEIYIIYTFRKYFQYLILKVLFDMLFLYNTVYS